MAWNRDQSNMELGQWYGMTVGYVPYLVRLQLLLDYLYPGVNGFLLLLCLLHPTHCQTIVTDFTSFYCDSKIEVTVNTCTCTDMFTVITTKDQSGGILAQVLGGQGFMAVVNKPPRAMPSDSLCLLP